MCFSTIHREKHVTYCPCKQVDIQADLRRQGEEKKGPEKLEMAIKAVLQQSGKPGEKNKI